MGRILTVVLMCVATIVVVGCERGEPDLKEAHAQAPAESATLEAAAVKDYVAALDEEARQALLGELGCAPQAAAAPERRTGVVERQGQPLTLLGPDLEVGDPAPAFTLVDTAMQPIHSADLAGELVVLSVVPSLDTPVCEIQTGTLLSRYDAMPPGTRLITVSRDLPFAQRRFLEHKQESMPIPEGSRVASDYRDGDFGRSWGLLVDESGLLARSLWVIGKDGTILYRQIVRDQATEPDYDALLEALAGLEQ